MKKNGYLILGAADNKYLKEIKNISSDEIQYSYSSTLSSSIEWMVHFQSIFYHYSEDLMKKMDYELPNKLTEMENQLTYMIDDKTKISFKLSDNIVYRVTISSYVFEDE